jgi:hypothetical protein
MHKPLSRSLRCLITAAMLLSLSAVAPSLITAQQLPSTIVAFTPVAVCMRPVGGGTADGVGMEGIFGQCSGDNSFFWTVSGSQASGRWWYTNAKSGKCLNAENTSLVVQKLITENLLRHSEEPAVSVPGSYTG